MSLQSIVAIMSEGALYCAEHAQFDSEDIEQGHVVPITEFDRMVGEGSAEWLDDSCCSTCGKEF